jgi:hypothetical protein
VYTGHGRDYAFLNGNITYNIEWFLRKLQKFRAKFNNFNTQSIIIIYDCCNLISDVSKSDNETTQHRNDINNLAEIWNFNEIIHIQACAENQTTKFCPAKGSEFSNLLISTLKNHGGCWESIERVMRDSNIGNFKPYKNSGEEGVL